MGRYDARARVQTCIYSQIAEATRGPLSAAIRLMASICRCRWSRRSLWGRAAVCQKGSSTEDRRRRVWEIVKCRRRRRWNVHFGVMCRLGPLVIFMEQPLVPRHEQIPGIRHRFEPFWLVKEEKKIHNVSVRTVIGVPLADLLVKRPRQETFMG